MAKIGNIHRDGCFSFRLGHSIILFAYNLSWFLGRFAHDSPIIFNNPLGVQTGNSRINDYRFLAVSDGRGWHGTRNHFWNGTPGLIRLNGEVCL